MQEEKRDLPEENSEAQELPTKEPDMETAEQQESMESASAEPAEAEFAEAEFAEDEFADAGEFGKDEGNLDEKLAALLNSEQTESEEEELLGLARREHKRWQRIYTLTVTAVLALCLGILIGAMIQGAGQGGGLFGNVTVVGGGDEQTIQLSALESVRNYTVVITAKTEGGVSTGTGIILTADGYIATNHHVIEDATTIKVKMYDGTSAVATVVGYSEIDDLAVIKIEASGLYAASFASSAEVVDGQNVYAVGTPAGEEYAWSVTKGIVSFAQREVKIYDDEGILVKKMKLIQTDTPVNPGNSGGPLVNSNGQVIGIITMKLSGSYENMGFAIPIDGAMTILRSIIETGQPGDSPITTKRPLIGIVGVGVQADCYYIDLGDKIQQVDKEYADQHPDEVFYAPYTGVWVQSVSPGFDAASKLQPNDIIVLADGQELTTIYDLMAAVNKHNGGETIEITYYRNGVANIVDVTLGSAD